MNISDFVRANAARGFLTSSAKTQTPGNLSAVSKGLEKADTRIQAQVDTTTAGLSAFGKLKSSISDAQIRARTLASLPATAKGTEVKAAASNFVNAFNSAISTANSTAGVAYDPLSNHSATKAGKNLMGAVGPDAATIASLKAVGLSLGLDGKLVLDSTKFDAAQQANPSGLRDTLSKIGQQADKAASAELTTNGGVGLSLTSLNQRFSVLKSQQSAIASLQQSASTGQSNTGSGFFGYGLSGYQSR